MDDTAKLVTLFLACMIIGIAACLPLYKFRFAALRRSSLWTKIMWWIPIFVLFLTIRVWGLVPAITIGVSVLILSVYEFASRHAYRHFLAIIYWLLFAFGIISLPAYYATDDTTTATAILSLVAFASVFSDVFAFFFGKYLGRHHLPDQLNNRKSWEGVGGQIVGALVGGLIVGAVLDNSYTISSMLLVGISSACGDLANSYVKRRLGVKDWAQTIPGHGGVLDRLSSLSFALGLSYLYWPGILN